MKKLITLSLLLVFLFPKPTQAQDDGLAVAAAGLVAIGAGIAAVNQMKEQAELTATQWVLTNKPEMTSFSLKTLDFDGKKLKDVSSASVITYKIQEFTPGDKPELDGKKRVLFGFTSRGWISEYGIDFSKVNWYFIDSDEWMDMMVAYAKVSSAEKNEDTLKKVLKNGKIVNRGIKDGWNLEVPFFKMDGDMYLVSDYSNEMKLIYNERSLGIFIKDTQDLVQIGRGDIIKIHEFFFEEG